MASAEKQMERVMSKMGKRLLTAAKSARAIARGEADAATYRVHVPADVDVVKIRRKLELSQSEFASQFGIAPGTLRDWEQHRKRPEGAARVLLLIIDRDPDAVRRALRRPDPTPAVRGDKLRKIEPVREHTA
jgi:putative transcriptional regulator